MVETNSYWVLFKTCIRLFWIRIINLADSLSSVVNLLIFGFLVISILVVLIFARAQILVVAYPTIRESYTVDIFNIFRYDIVSLSPTQYSAILSAASGAMALVVTICFAVFSGINLNKYRKNIKKQAVIQTKRIYINGVDDLKIMLEYYKLAGYVAVFARDFDWITKNSGLKDEIIRLANQKKIDLFSSENLDIVKNAINNEFVFDLLKERFHFNTNKKILCSLVETEGARVFLYRSKQEIYGGENYICIVRGVNEGQPLLEMITKLLELRG